VSARWGSRVPTENSTARTTENESSGASAAAWQRAHEVDWGSVWWQLRQSWIVVTERLPCPSLPV
jgi:hypothetical protein